VAADAPRRGEGGVGCHRCEAGVVGALWHDDNWVLDSLDRPSGLPCVVLPPLPEDVWRGNLEIVARELRSS